jgi:DNA helicase-2/ATP-dependent DNA helicase PcrA
MTTSPYAMLTKGKLALTWKILKLLIAYNVPSKKLILALLKPYTEYIKNKDIAVTDSNAASIISRAKAKGQSAAEYLKEVDEKERRFKKSGPQQDHKSMEKIIAEVYIGYEQVLQNNNALDFDDLLVYGVRLFSSHQQAVIWCRHILVDEL